MKRLKAFGFFKELEHGDPNGGSIYDFLHSNADENAEHIINYLISGEMFVGCAGIEFDILSKEEKTSGNPSIVTDGTWVWSGDLPYYIKNYNLRIPDEMLQNMKNNNWQVPRLSSGERMIYAEDSYDQLFN